VIPGPLEDYLGVESKIAKFEVEDEMCGRRRIIMKMKKKINGKY
jgi:hypothetical protein